MIYAGTGHRPKDLGGYHIMPILDKLAIDFLAEALKRREAVTVISGMALGWDTALAVAAISLDIPLWAYVPFRGQESIWPTHSKALYETILEAADKVVVFSPGGFAPEKMQIRNERMVDDCDAVLAYWAGKTHGGTFNCIKYAKKQNKPIINLYKPLL